MRTEDYKFLKDNIEPLEDSVYGLGYRVSAYLTDGTYLPCVVFRNPSKIVDLAIMRFKDEQTGKGFFSRSSDVGYRDIVRTFVTKGNCLNDYDIEKVEKSRNVFPLSIQNQIRGETTMGWTGFVAKMKDGKYFGFGSQFRWEFFDFPDGYSGEDVVEIINHSYISKFGDVKSHQVPFFDHPDDYAPELIHREKPYFECFTNEI
jgi:hypothetical protein